MSASWIAQCQRHARRFPDREAALKALAALRKRGGIRGRLMPWKCPNGNDHWHLGTDPRYRRRSR